MDLTRHFWYALATLADVDHGFFRAWWFDPLTATAGFGVAGYLYWNQERKQNLIQQFGNNTDEGFFGSWGPCNKSLTLYWAGIMFWKVLVPAPTQLPDGIPTNLTSLVTLLTEIITGILAYDAIIFVVHWAMHDIPALRHIHKEHHSSNKKSNENSATTTTTTTTTVQALDVLRHSLVDGSVQVLCNIAVQRRNLVVGPVKSRLARACHNAIVTWMLVESHTASPSPYIFRRWFVGVREHRLHHYNGGATKGLRNNRRHRDGVAGGDDDEDEVYYGVDHRYQQFFGYLDDARAKYQSWRQRSRRKEV